MLPLPRGAVWQLLFLFCAALYISGVRSDGRVVCYYTNWSVYRPGTAKFNPQNINPYLCTHLIYAFGGFTKDNQMKPFDKYQDIEQGGYAKFTGLKTYNKQLKTMIAIGGWNEASSRFSPLVSNPERRQKFIKNILKFLRQNHFDGIDLDWEYPAHREGGKPRDRENYAQFVQELRAEFERESEKTGRPRLLLTMAVPAGIEYIEKGYDIPKLNKYLDWFNLLTYDFHSSHEPSVNHHAPLYSLEEESEYNYDAELNIDYSIKFYLNAGADRDKLVLGIPTYGRSYTLINEESTEIGAPAEGPGEQGDATREKGYLAFYEICQNLKEDPEWTVVQPNPNAMGPYAYRRTQWVGYDDEAIVRKKAQYVVENGLGGIMFWAIDNDDFRGSCTGKPYPLIEAAKEAMLDALGFGINEVSKPSAPQKPSRSRSRENSSSTRNRITTSEHKLTYAERKGSKRTETTQQNTRPKTQSTTTAAPIKLTEAEGSSLYIGGRTTTPPPPTTPDPGTDFKCEEEGFFQHPRDCKKYYWCLDSGPSGLGIVAHQFTCPSGLYFNPAADSCDFARNVPCKTKKSTTAAPITSPATTTTTARTTASFNRVTAATSRPTTFFRTTPRTTTTTTEAYVDEPEYEEEEDSVPSPFAKTKGFDKDSEEDPKVIKELIELIRKVGGIEELEKHLLRKEDGTISIKEHSSSSSSTLTATTPSSISKSLYDKVLSKPNALNSFRNRFTSTSSFRTTKTQTKTQGNTEEVEVKESHESDTKSSGASNSFSKYSSVVRGNSRQGPQNEGIDKLTEFDGFLKEKKQYITINRNRGTQKTTVNEEDAEEEEAKKSNAGSFRQEAEEEEEQDEVIVRTTRKPFSSVTPSYSSIRRTRPSTTTEATNDETEDIEEKKETERKSYSSLNRSRVRGTTTTESPEVSEVTAGSSRYKYLERTRPTLTTTTTESSNKVGDEEDTLDEEDDDTRNKENTVHFKAVNIENTRETQQEITKNTQRTYASIGRRTTTTATPETETTTNAAKTSTTTATPPTTSTTETPITTPLTIIETTTPESVLITTNIPITTTTNPTTIATTTTTTSTTTTTTKTTTLPKGEDILDSLNTTPLPNDINSDVSETLDLNINSLLTESSSPSSFSSFSTSTTSSPSTESGLDTNEQEIDNHTTTETTKATVVNGNDKLTKTTDIEEHEEVNLVSKQRNKTLFNTRTRITTTPTKTTTTTPPTTTTNSDIETTTTSPTTNAKKTLGVRRQQQVLLNRSSQTKKTITPTTTTTTDTPIPTTESVNNDFLGTVSSPRPFGFPKRRTRPTTINVAGTTTTSATSFNTTDEVVKVNEESLVTKQKSTTTKLNAAANSQIKLRTPTTVNNNGFTVTRRPVLSVRRRLINSSTTAAANNSATLTTIPTLTTQPVSSSILNDEFTTTSKFKRLRTNRPPTINAAAVDITTTDATAATESFKSSNNKLKKKSSETTANDLRLASSSLTSSSADNDITARSQSSSIAFRRKYQARRLTTSVPGNTNSDGTATEPPRTQNPLFKRRYSLTTFSPLSSKTLLPASSSSRATTSASATLRTGAIDSLTTTVYVDGLENDEATDQIAKSSIHTSRFNQINGRLHIDDDDEEDIEGIGDVGSIGGGDLRHVVNTVKPITTLSSQPTTTQPTLPVPQQQQQQQYSKYNFEDVITRRMDGTGTVGKSPYNTTTISPSTTTTTTTPTSAIKKRKMVTKRRPQKVTPSSEATAASKRRRPNKNQDSFDKINSNQAKTVVKTTQQQQLARTYRPNLDYDYYDDEDVRLVGNKKDQQLKVILHGRGIIECLDQGNFPHPLSCRKFISCAKFETGGVVGWEYTCPKGLSYDPVGGMCNWAAGLGCKE